MKYRIIKTILLFAVAFGFQSLTTSQIITMNRYVWEMVFIVTMLVILFTYFKDVFQKVFSKSSKFEKFLLLLTSLTFHFASIYYILNYCNQPIWSFDPKGSSFLLMNRYFIWVKPLDIVLQQSLLILLISKLRELKLSVEHITVLCVIGFGVIHFFQVFITDSVVGLGYAIGATLFSLIIPYMIIRIKNGYIYNFMIHLAAYDIAALLAWTLY